jgi:hypothetical protein
MEQTQKETIKWIAIIGVGGLVVYNVGKKLGIFSDNTPTSPNVDTNTPKASDYTHTPNFNPQGLINQIVNDWTAFGGDPFPILFNQIKQSVKTQGDWQTFNLAFTAIYKESVGDYITSWIQHAPWAAVSKSELTQLITYINNLPL